MTIIKVTNCSNNKVVGDKITVADNSITKMIGLLSKSTLDIGEGLLIKGCNSIHSFGMKFIFDAVYLNNANIVVHTEEAIRPWRILPIIFSAKNVLELPSGMVKLSDIKTGDYLKFS